MLLYSLPTESFSSVIRNLRFFTEVGYEDLAQELSEQSKLPELPSFITLIYRKFKDYEWAAFLHHWENLIFSIIIALLIALVFYLGSRRKEMIPSGLQNFLEMTIEGMRSLITGILGPQGEKYVPFLGILFIYLLTMNIFGLIPLMKSPSASLNITVAHAICVFLLVQYLSFKNYGFWGFMYHLAGSPKDALGWAMVPLMFPIELLTQLSRPVTLAFRLFGNIFGEDILIAYLAVAGLTLLPTILPIPIQTPFLFLGLLTGIIQAFVFTLLTTVYILLSIPSHEENNHL